MTEIQGKSITVLPGSNRVSEVSSYRESTAFSFVLESGFTKILKVSSLKIKSSSKVLR